jgi:phosphate transport system protein
MFKEIETLKKKLLSLTALVEEAVSRSVQSTIERDPIKAQKVIDMDDQIDQMELAIEEEGLKILALHQPVASDLRFIVSVMKINNDLERVGDLAVTISKNAIYLSQTPSTVIPFDLSGMATKVRAMLKASLDAMINQDMDVAQQVLAMDDDVDAINRSMYDAVKNFITQHPDEIHAMIDLMNISRSLERIADLTTNIAEDTIYMICGKIVRHRKSEIERLLKNLPRRR